MNRFGNNYILTSIDPFLHEIVLQNTSQTLRMHTFLYTCLLLLHVSETGHLKDIFNVYTKYIDTIYMLLQNVHTEMYQKGFYSPNSFTFKLGVLFK